MNTPIITIKQLVRIFSDQFQTASENRFAFVTGAGASVSSGIMSGARLAKEWLVDIEEDHSKEEFDQWKDNLITIKGNRKPLSEVNAGEYYSEIYQKRFKHNIESGYDTLLDSMKDVEPSLGYIYLARILDNSTNNVVITTNFDSLLETALYKFTGSQPLVIGHESLANYFRPNSPRPTILKIHRDLLLEPKNVPGETGEIDKSWAKALSPIIKQRCLIVIGYGGNDGSLMDYLEDSNENRKPIYWCVIEPDTLSSRVKSLLTEDDRIVRIRNFDSAMINIGLTLELEHLVNPDEEMKGWLWDDTKRRDKKYRQELLDFAKESPDEGQKLKAELPYWYDYEDAVSTAKTDKEKDAIYREGIKNTQSHDLMGNYAIFLQTVRKDYDQAEKYYLHALENDLNHANKLGNYAIFLENIRKDYDQAEIYYQRALKSDSDHANNLGAYAYFLQTIRKENNQAENYYKQALVNDLNHPINQSNYAIFLQTVRKDYDQAEKYYLQALKSDPNHTRNLVNYAIFLHNFRKDYDQAEKYYLKALKSDPNNAINQGAYAYFLQTIRKDYNQAEIYYKQALVNDPNHVNIIGNYAQLLLSMGKKQEGNANLNKAIELAKIDANNTLLAELWFYNLAHNPELAEKAKKELERLLSNGVKSPGWNFTINIDRAAVENTADIKLLKGYAKRITDVEH